MAGERSVEGVLGTAASGAGALELVAVAGTTALFLAARGPGRALLARVGRGWA